MTKKTAKDTCVMCGAASIERRIETQQFIYADSRRDVLLTADVPVEYCRACGEVLLGEEGEIARHEAVCNYLGRLSPSEIKAIRRGLQLTQKALAAKINAGLASVKRWETGAVVQNASMDSLLRRVANNTGRQEAEKRRFTPVFRTEIKVHMISDAALFQLRPRA
ncbi:type II TA system antitoxin MqsA family protein [Pikeienuella sp. HZG-20]|uniref:type II TA system antitoxin MqsA family protein n=1 Tax=Paludibacillus litoralis TaxID=3133267 RepID=UPI0030EECB24